MNSIPDSWSVLVDAWCRWMRSSGAPAGSIRLRRDYVRRLSFAHPSVVPTVLTSEDLTDWMAGHDWSPNTRKSVRSTLRSFYGWMVASGRMNASPAHLLPPVRVPRGRARPTPEIAYREALARASDRERLAILLAGQCGLRLGEVAGSAREHVEPDLLGWTLRVVGKGGHTRLVPLPEDLAQQVLARPAGWLFPSPHGGHLSANYLGKLISRNLPGSLTTHTLRHRCATIAYSTTKDLRAVQELLGHARPETTAAYTAVPDTSVRAAMLAAAA